MAVHKEGGRGPKRAYPSSLKGNEKLTGGLPVDVARCQETGSCVHHGDDREGLVQDLEPNGVRQEALVEPVCGAESGLRHLGWWGQLLACRALVLLCCLIDHTAGTALRQHGAEVLVVRMPHVSVNSGYYPGRLCGGVALELLEASSRPGSCGHRAR